MSAYGVLPCSSLLLAYCCLPSRCEPSHPARVEQTQGIASDEEREGQWRSAERLSRFMYEEIQLCRDRLREAWDVKDMPRTRLAEHRPVISQLATAAVAWCPAGSCDP
jgi:hypothetical protein